MFTLPVLDEDQPKPRPTLVGHVIATRTSKPYVTDKAMELPADWQTQRATVVDGEVVGHDEYGSSIAIHSLAVLPEHQGKHVGSTLMKSYIQRIREAQIADRIVIIVHDNLLSFYEGLGFENQGPSKCKFGGGGWIDMVSFIHMPFGNMLTRSDAGVRQHGMRSIPSPNCASLSSSSPFTTSISF